MTRNSRADIQNCGVLPAHAGLPLQRTCQPELHKMQPSSPAGTALSANPAAARPRILSGLPRGRFLCWESVMHKRVHGTPGHANNSQLGNGHLMPSIKHKKDGGVAVGALRQIGICFAVLHDHLQSPCAPINEFGDVAFFLVVLLGWQISYHWPPRHQAPSAGLAVHTPQRTQTPGTYLWKFNAGTRHPPGIDSSLWASTAHTTHPPGTADTNHHPGVQDSTAGKGFTKDQ